jgi:hypothetical protein
MQPKTRFILCAAALSIPAVYLLAEDPGTQSTSPTVNQLEIQIAEARCELVRQRLASARAQNRTPFLTVVYEEAVQNFERELADLRAGKRHSAFDRLLVQIGYLARISSHRITQAEAANSKNPGTVDTHRLAQMKARHDMLRLAAVQGDLLKSASRDVQTEWQLEQLRSLQILLMDQLFEEGM